MNFVKRLFRRLAPVLIIPLAVPLLAGPIPFTQMQFPEWFAVAPQPVSVTNSTEQILYQVALPNNVIGSAGFMRITSLLSGDNTLSNHVETVYLGGVGTNSPPTGATPLATNSFTIGPGAVTSFTPIINWVFPFAGAYSNRVYSQQIQSTNSGGNFQSVIVGTQTNTTLLTITGINVAATNWFTLDALIVEALNQ